MPHMPGVVHSVVLVSKKPLSCTSTIEFPKSGFGVWASYIDHHRPSPPTRGARRSQGARLDSIGPIHHVIFATHQPARCPAGQSTWRPPCFASRAAPASDVAQSKTQAEDVEDETVLQASAVQFRAPFLLAVRCSQSGLTRTIGPSSKCVHPLKITQKELMFADCFFP